MFDRCRYDTAAVVFEIIAHTEMQRCHYLRLIALHVSNPENMGRNPGTSEIPLYSHGS